MGISPILAIFALHYEFETKILRIHSKKDYIVSGYNSRETAEQQSVLHSFLRCIITDITVA